MTATMQEQTVLPPDADEEQNLLGVLAKQLATEQQGGHAVLLGPDGSELELPGPVFQALRDVVSAMSQGLAITVAPHNTMLTTQEAADLLGISRPTLIKRLEAGEIPYVRHGRHRKMRLKDVVAYQHRTWQEREEALDEMAAAGQETGFYEDTLRPLPQE
ncbi:DNA binding domain-containing protein, excisionase family [Actinopolyspora xinjiangensis]|uniref:DNA binding domain-containing protein, excisionase family n=1 Tax=Actinopolyspora xinjiangensis TaxID=405564 RepID=A0A1H0U9N8_9ACTN|nr:helix-turn-helix domain-containing protein [Actinopolyspora xinjiangensis]SDP62879.1 DNA binding domain-containing protein, excisionase family [Actinopolyspora xinjiangensis]